MFGQRRKPSSSTVKLTARKGSSRYFLSNDNEADIRVGFMNRSELGNLPLDTSRKNKPVCFERANRIDAFGKKGIHYFSAAVPTIAQEKRGNRGFREFRCNITRDLNFGPRFVIQDHRIVQDDPVKMTVFKAHSAKRGVRLSRRVLSWCNHQKYPL